MPTATGRTSEPRERLLRTASEIFYTEGIHHVGVDRILDRATVTRSTFYRHFPSKEALVLAYVQAVDASARAALEQAGGADLGPRDRLRALGGLMTAQICRPGFRGCAFINAAAEYPDPASPVRRAVSAHREWLSGTVTTALHETGHPDPDGAARHLILLRDGAMIAGYLGDPDLARQTLDQGLEAVLSVARRPHSPR